MPTTKKSEHTIKKIFYKNDDAVHSWTIWIIFIMIWLYIGRYENTNSLGIIICSIIFSSAVFYEKSVNSKNKDNSSPFKKIFKTKNNKSMSLGVYLFHINYMFLLLLIIHNISNNELDTIIDIISFPGVFFVIFIIYFLLIIPILYFEDWANDWPFGTSLKLSISPSHNVDMIKQFFEEE